MKRSSIYVYNTITYIYFSNKKCPYLIHDVLEKCDSHVLFEIAKIKYDIERLIKNFETEI